MSVTTGASSKTPKAPKPAKSLHWLSEVTKPTYSRPLLKTSVLPFFRQAFIFWHFSPSPLFFFHMCHLSHPQMLFPEIKKKHPQCVWVQMWSCMVTVTENGLALSSSSLKYFCLLRKLLYQVKTRRGRGSEGRLRDDGGSFCTKGPGGPWGPMLSCVHVQEWGRDGHLASSLWKGPKLSRNTHYYCIFNTNWQSKACLWNL